MGEKTTMKQRTFKQTKLSDEGGQQEENVKLHEDVVKEPQTEGYPLTSEVKGKTSRISAQGGDSQRRIHPVSSQTTKRMLLGALAVSVLLVLLYSFWYRRPAKTFTQEAQEKWKDLKDETAETYYDTKHKAADQYQYMKEGVQSKASDQYQNLKEGLREAKDWTKEKGEEAKDKMWQYGENAKEKVQEFGESAKERGKEAAQGSYQTLKDYSQKAVEKGKEGVGYLKEKVQEKACEYCKSSDDL